MRNGAVPESRLDASVRRILLSKFQQGLFENPLVDPDAAVGVVGSAEFRAEADAAQRRAMVVIENPKQAVPLKAGAKVFLHGVDAVAARERGLVPVARVEDADVALVRLETPFELLHPNHFFGQRQHEGRLDWRDGDKDYELIKATAARVPTVLAISLDRPVVLTNVRDKAAAIVGTFGASDAALLDVVAGRARAEGHLPFALPRSMADVESQSPGRPHDLASPLYPFGWPR